MKHRNFFGGIYIAIIFATISSANARELTGYVSNIIDVDVWEIRGETIQMWGVAVPQYNDNQDPDILDKIEVQIDKREVKCISVDAVGNSDHPVMKCSINGFDVSRMLVRQGFARDCPKITDGKYMFDEKFAVEARGANISEWFPVPRECQ